MAHQKYLVVAKQASITAAEKISSIVAEQTASFNFEATEQTSSIMAEQTDSLSSEATLQIASIVTDINSQTLPEQNSPIPNLPTAEEKVMQMTSSLQNQFDIFCSTCCFFRAEGRKGSKSLLFISWY